MKVYEYVPGTQIDEESTVVALGFFDGVHAAHRSLLKKAKEISRAEGLTFAVFTFRAENVGLKGDARIYSTEEKLEILEGLGTDAVILADFPSVSGIEAEDFVKSALLSDMKCKVAVAGYDFRFGKGARGDVSLLTSLLSSAGADCYVEEEQKIEGEKISTTKIKELLKGGKVSEAISFLGMPYFITAEVRHGKGLGRKLGFPTVNCDFKEGALLIKKGVYRTAVKISGKLCSAITNVGVCPTFDGGEALHCETYIIGYSGDLYGQKIRIFFLGFLRDEKKFDRQNDLILQINVDKNTAISQNGDLKWLETGLN